MEGIGAAASILAIGTAGVQVSIKLAAFANQVGTAPNRIRSIASDVSLTASVLQQLSELLNKNDDDKAVNVFNEDGLATTQASADACKTVFQELDDVLQRASQQIRENRGKTILGQKIVLSKPERMKWPFLQPKIDSLRTALRDARETLMLMLHVTTLGYMKKQAEMTRSSTGVSYEQSELVGVILALHSQGFGVVPDNIQRSKTGQSEIDPTLPPKDVTKAIESSDLNVQASQSPSRTRESLLSSKTSTDRSIFDPPDRRVSSETQFTEASTQSSIPQTPAFLSALRNRVKREDECEVLDQGSNKDSNNPSLREVRAQRSQNQSVLETTARSTTIMEAWMVMPRVFRADEGCGYDLRWRMNVWPIDSTEMKRLVREMSGWRKPDTLKQLASLTSMEREVVNRYLALRGNSLNGDFTVKSVGFRSMEPVVEPNTRMPWRSIQVLIARKSPGRIVPSARARLTAGDVSSLEKASEMERKRVHRAFSPYIDDGDPGHSAEGLNPCAVTIESDHPRASVMPIESKIPYAYSSTSAAYSTHFESDHPSSRRTSADVEQSLRVTQERSKPQCWDHGCNGRKFSTFSNLLRHQRETSGLSSKCVCPRCGAEFTRTTARNAHVAEGKCTDKSTNENRDDQPEQLEESDVPVINKHAIEELKQNIERKVGGLTKPHYMEQSYAEGTENPEEEVENESQAKGESPFAGLNRLLVVAGGIVADNYGKTVGHVVEGDQTRLVGYAVDEDGDIVDKYGNIKGHAEPIQEAKTKKMKLGSRVSSGDVFKDENIPEQVAKNTDTGFQSWDMKDLEEEDVYGDLDEMWIDAQEEKVEDETETRIEEDPRSLMADEKRKRNATASHRFRQRRKEAEQANANYIANLERQIREMKEDAMMRLDEEQDVPGRVDMVPNVVETDSPQDVAEDAGSLECCEEVVEDEAETAAEGEESYEEKAERIIQELLGRYTTLYDQ